jgi:glycine/D-amino acid oxidase-like deaminating enzyme
VQITRLPKDDVTNGWAKILPPRTAKPALENHSTADWLVLGAGYAGLAAARRLAENRPDEKIVVLDATEAGLNASGRNSGFGIDLPHIVGTLEELDGSRKYMNLARAALGYLEKSVKEHKINCDWSKDGKYQTASSARGEKELLEPFAKELDALGEPFTWVNAAGCKEKLGTSHFHSAIYTPGCILMNPAGLTAGLADSLPSNVELYENAPVTEIEYQNGVLAQTPTGSVRAPRMILAVNGWVNRFGFYKSKLMPMAAHASLSRPLTVEERAACGVEKPWGVTPANAFVSITMRYTNDHRILIREGIGYCPAQKIGENERQALAKRHKRLFDKRFPMLPAVEMEHIWSGFVSMARNGSPGFGQVAPNIWTAVCQNAVGVTKGTVAGLLAADMACGIVNPLIHDMQSLGTPNAFPPRPFMDVGVRAKLAWTRATNKHEV